MGVSGHLSQPPAQRPGRGVEAQRLVEGPAAVLGDDDDARSGVLVDRTPGGEVSEELVAHLLIVRLHENPLLGMCAWTLCP